MGEAAAAASSPSTQAVTTVSDTTPSSVTNGNLQSGTETQLEDQKEGDRHPESAEEQQYWHETGEHLVNNAQSVARIAVQLSGRNESKSTGHGNRRVTTNRRPAALAEVDTNANAAKTIATESADFGPEEDSLHLLQRMGLSMAEAHIAHEQRHHRHQKDFEKKRQRLVKSQSEQLQRVENRWRKHAQGLEKKMRQRLEREQQHYDQQLAIAKGRHERELVRFQLNIEGLQGEMEGLRERLRDGKRELEQEKRKSIGKWEKWEEEVRSRERAETVVRTLRDKLQVVAQALQQQEKEEQRQQAQRKADDDRREREWHQKLLVETEKRERAESDKLSQAFALQVANQGVDAAKEQLIESAKWRQEALASREEAARLRAELQSEIDIQSRERDKRRHENEVAERRAIHELRALRTEYKEHTAQAAEELARAQAAEQRAKMDLKTSAEQERVRAAEEMQKERKRMADAHTEALESMQAQFKTYEAKCREEMLVEMEDTVTQRLQEVKRQHVQERNVTLVSSHKQPGLDEEEVNQRVREMLRQERTKWHDEREDAEEDRRRRIIRDHERELDLRQERHEHQLKQQIRQHEAAMSRVVGEMERAEERVTESRAREAEAVVLAESGAKRLRALEQLIQDQSEQKQVKGHRQLRQRLHETESRERAGTDQAVNHSMVGAVEEVEGCETNLATELAASRQDLDDIKQERQRNKVKRGSASIESPRAEDEVAAERNHQMQLQVERAVQVAEAQAEVRQKAAVAEAVAASEIKHAAAVQQAVAAAMAKTVAINVDNSTCNPKHSQLQQQHQQQQQQTEAFMQQLTVAAESRLKVTVTAMKAQQQAALQVLEQEIKEQHQRKLMQQQEEHEQHQAEAVTAAVKEARANATDDREKEDAGDGSDIWNMGSRRSRRWDATPPEPPRNQVANSTDQHVADQQHAGDAAKAVAKALVKAEASKQKEIQEQVDRAVEAVVRGKELEQEKAVAHAVAAAVATAHSEKQKDIKTAVDAAVFQAVSDKERGQQQAIARAVDAAVAAAVQASAERVEKQQAIAASTIALAVQDKEKEQQEAVSAAVAAAVLESKGREEERQAQTAEAVQEAVASAMVAKEEGHKAMLAVAVMEAVTAQENEHKMKLRAAVTAMEQKQSAAVAAAVKAVVQGREGEEVQRQVKWQEREREWSKQYEERVQEWEEGEVEWEREIAGKEAERKELLIKYERLRQEFERLKISLKCMQDQKTMGDEGYDGGGGSVGAEVRRLEAGILDRERKQWELQQTEVVATALSAALKRKEEENETAVVDAVQTAKLNCKRQADAQLAKLIEEHEAATVEAAAVAAAAMVAREHEHAAALQAAVNEAVVNATEEAEIARQCAVAEAAAGNRTNDEQSYGTAGGDVDREWEACTDENGNQYYYNNLTGESSWERPTRIEPEGYLPETAGTPAAAARPEAEPEAAGADTADGNEARIAEAVETALVQAASEAESRQILAVEAAVAEALAVAAVRHEEEQSLAVAQAVDKMQADVDKRVGQNADPSAEGIHDRGMSLAAEAEVEKEQQVAAPRSETDAILGVAEKATAAEAEAGAGEQKQQGVVAAAVEQEKNAAEQRQRVAVEEAVAAALAQAVNEKAETGTFTEAEVEAEVARAISVAMESSAEQQRLAVESAVAQTLAEAEERQTTAQQVAVDDAVTNAIAETVKSREERWREAMAVAVLEAVEEKDAEWKGKSDALQVQLRIMEQGRSQHEQEMQRAAAIAVQMQEELQEKLKLRELEHVKDRQRCLSLEEDLNTLKQELGKAVRRTVEMESLVEAAESKKRALEQELVQRLEQATSEGAKQLRQAVVEAVGVREAELRAEMEETINATMTMAVQATAKGTPSELHTAEVASGTDGHSDGTHHGLDEQEMERRVDARVEQELAAVVKRAVTEAEQRSTEHVTQQLARQNADISKNAADFAEERSGWAEEKIGWEQERAEWRKVEKGLAEKMSLLQQQQEANILQMQTQMRQQQQQHIKKVQQDCHKQAEEQVRRAQEQSNDAVHTEVQQQARHLAETHEKEVQQMQTHHAEQVQKLREHFSLQQTQAQQQIRTLHEQITKFEVQRIQQKDARHTEGATSPTTGVVVAPPLVAVTPYILREAVEPGAKERSSVQASQQAPSEAKHDKSDREVTSLHVAAKPGGRKSPVPTGRYIPQINGNGDTAGSPSAVDSKIDVKPTPTAKIEDPSLFVQHHKAVVHSSPAKVSTAQVLLQQQEERETIARTQSSLPSTPIAAVVTQIRDPKTTVEPE